MAEIAHQLQQVDSALDRAQRRQADIEIGLRERSVVDAALVARQEAEAALRRVEVEERDLELEVDDLRGKLRALEKKLYGGTVKNPKELESLTQDAAQIRRQISVREDRALALIDDIEAAQARHDEAVRAAEAAETELRERVARLRAERAELRQEVARWEGERETLRGQLDAAALRTYDSLRRTRGGIAVGEVKQRACQACRVELPLNEIQRARTSPDYVLCQSCGRILYVDLYG